MSEDRSDSLAQAAARLEAAVERLARIAARRPRMADQGEAGLSRPAIAAIADRLDETIARLRATLGEDG